MTSSYIARAACHGKRPALFQADSGFQRSHLLSRLLKERDVARFIVAPAGYGKSLLAVDYAETVFDWAHTFWFNAQSPCFIRDLDAQALAASCLEFDEHAALAIFDEVPALDDVRTQIFSHQIDELMNAGVEVIVTMAPACVFSGAYQNDRLELDAWDLLLLNEELKQATAPGSVPYGAGSSAAYGAAGSLLDDRHPEVPAWQRIAALVWGAQGEGHAARTFKQHLLEDELPADMLYAIATMLVLQGGAMDMLGELAALDEDALARLRHDYPHLGISDDLRSFQCVPVSIRDLFANSRGLIGDFALHTTAVSRIALLEIWAAQLLALGKAERACNLIAFLATRPEGMTWCMTHQRDLVAQACFFALLPLLPDAHRISAATRAQVEVLQALSYQILGENAAASAKAQRIIADATAPDEQRAWASMVMCRVGTPEEVRLALNCLQQLDVQVLELSATTPDWQLLVRMRLACDEGLFATLEMWNALRELGVKRDVLCTGAAWIFTLYRNAEDGGAHGRGVASALAPIEHYVRAVLMECSAREERPDFFAASAGLALEHAHARGLAYDEGPLPAGILFALRQVEMYILAQRGQLARMVQSAHDHARETHDISDASVSAQMPSRALLDKGAFSQVQVQQRVPLLSLRLFGSFAAMVGDESIDDRLSRRRNARTLLAMLAVNNGKEMSRDALAQMMWPESDVHTARKNFYTVWGFLRQALTLPDGNCPYLIRHQYGCSLEQRHVKSDVKRLSELCRELLFGPAERNNWLSLYTEINRDFASDLLPGETNNMLISAARDKLKSHLIDALVSAAGNVMQAGQPQWGVYFAREAIEHDDTREDAYVALMRAQIAASQRTSAMMTYIRCQEVLSDQLGIDPSPETEAIYSELLAGSARSVIEPCEEQDHELLINA